MKQLIMEPDGWNCTLEEYPPGFFTAPGGMLGFKSRYMTGDHPSEYRLEAFCDTGEFFHGGAKSEEERRQIPVSPCTPRWVETEFEKTACPPPEVRLAPPPEPKPNPSPAGSSGAEAAEKPGGSDG